MYNERGNMYVQDGKFKIKLFTKLANHNSYNEAVAGKDSSITFWAQPEPFRFDKKKNLEASEEPIPCYLRPSGTERNSGEIFKTFAISMLPPGNTVILLYDGGKRVATKARCGCQVCI